MRPVSEGPRSPLLWTLWGEPAESLASRFRFFFFFFFFLTTRLSSSSSATFFFVFSEQGSCAEGKRSLMDTAASFSLVSISLSLSLWMAGQCRISIKENKNWSHIKGRRRTLNWERADASRELEVPQPFVPGLTWKTDEILKNKVKILQKKNSKEVRRSKEKLYPRHRRMLPIPRRTTLQSASLKYNCERQTFIRHKNQLQTQINDSSF